MEKTEPQFRLRFVCRSCRLPTVVTAMSHQQPAEGACERGQAVDVVATIGPAHARRGRSNRSVRSRS